MLFKVFYIVSSGTRFVQRSGFILAILVEGHPRNIAVKIILKSGHRPKKSCHLKVFLFLLWRLFFQWSETILAILVRDYLRNISM